MTSITHPTPPRRAKNAVFDIWLKSNGYSTNPKAMLSACRKHLDIPHESEATQIWYFCALTTLVVSQSLKGDIAKYISALNLEELEKLRNNLREISSIFQAPATITLRNPNNSDDFETYLVTPKTHEDLLPIINRQIMHKRHPPRNFNLQP
ncbi:hypothetical protein [Asticcacaulis machinosus]|uniref:Uncharacterized protein n=1 Tax=Asticcacaulis machinosus TaxID=2984211 RepID=A0ABT5HMR9_9CAUL|nr:hypothetical protein [Asticcacaulis machinosus]MDC7677535.1 hypothetical protein [Asticcacaulis machinosus]